MEDTTVVPSVRPTTEGSFTSYPNVIISPMQEGFIMPSGVSKLAIWPLSGIKADQEGFQRELHDYWNPHGEIRPSQHMSLSSNAGIAGVWNGIEIPLGNL